MRTATGAPKRSKGEENSVVASIQAEVPHEAALSVRSLTVSLPKGMERIHAVEDVSFDLR
jgi:peptide/nickel transport system ATP-binding protein